MSLTSRSPAKRQSPDEEWTTVEQPAKYTKIESDYARCVPSPRRTADVGTQTEDDSSTYAIDRDYWMTGEFIRRFRRILDYNNPPWYSLAQMPSAHVWRPRTSNIDVLTSSFDDTPMRIWVSGKVKSFAFYSGLTDKASRSRIDIALLREVDRVGLARVQDAGRSAGGTPTAPLPVLHANVYHNRQEVFANVYDATVEFKSKGLMATVHPAVLKVGDIVLLESIVSVPWILPQLPRRGLQ